MVFYQVHRSGDYMESRKKQIREMQKMKGGLKKRLQMLKDQV